MDENKRPIELIATWDTLQRIFIRPEDEKSGADLSRIFHGQSPGRRQYRDAQY